MSHPLSISPEQPWLAPLAGYSDLAMRVLCREAGAAVACTEMVSAKGLVYGAESRKGRSPSDDLLVSTPLEGFPAGAAADSPLVVQLFGDDPLFLGRAVSLLAGRGFTYFDLNLGCSVPKVLKTGSGAALARDISSAAAAARAMIEAAGPAGRVGFKLRLGWSAEEENYLELGRTLEDCGAAWLTLHPRYSRQGFGGRADWGALAKLKKYVNIPLIASGDLFDAPAAVRCLRETGADAVMFARGALSGPDIFRQFSALWKDGSFNEDLPGKAGRLEATILRHAELVRGLPEPPRRRKRGAKQPPASLMKMRGAVPRYTKELPGSRAFRVRLAACGSWEEFYALVAEYFAGLREDVKD